MGSVVNDPPRCAAWAAHAQVVFIRVVAPAERVPLKTARALGAGEPEVVTGAAHALVSEGGVAEYASCPSACLIALDPELANVCGAWRPRARVPFRGARHVVSARARSCKQRDAQEHTSRPSAHVAADTRGGARIVQQEQQTIHLIGYASEAELVRAVKSFQRVPAESD